MVNNARRRAGYTLIEMMLTVAIVGIVAVGGPSLLTQLIKFYQLHSAKIEIQRDARASLDILNRQLRQALSYTVGIDQVSGQPPYSRINFRTIDNRTISFYQSGHDLYQVSYSTTVIARNLQYIAFTYPRSDDPSIISVALTMEKSTYQGRYKALELSIEKVRVMN
jgi:prepilin-type N-terminal cleavage/methylation domain-containing protein